MYIPPAFRETRTEVLHALIRDHSFGTLVSMLDGQLFATHLPFLLEPQRGPHGTLLGHMARANPHWQSFRQPADGERGQDGHVDLESLVMFQGPHAYISPSWYETELSVPTWNYTAVHVYGRPSLLDEPRRVRELLERTVQTFEQDLDSPWSTTRLPEDYLANMARGIVAFEIPIGRLEGKRKLSQNRSAADRAGAASGLRARREVLGVAVANQMDVAT